MPRYMRKELGLLVRVGDRLGQRHGSVKVTGLRCRSRQVSQRICLLAWVGDRLSRHRGLVGERRGLFGVPGLRCGAGQVSQRPRPPDRVGDRSCCCLGLVGQRRGPVQVTRPRCGPRPSCDRPTAPPMTTRTRAGFPCSARVRHGRGRAPSVPRGRRCPHGCVCIPQPPPAALQRPVPVTPDLHVRPGMVFSRGISKGSLAFAPPGHSPHLWLPDGTGALGLEPRASHPAGQDPAAHAGAGTGLRHWPGVTSSLTTSLDVPTHNERRRVAMHGEERSSPGNVRVVTANLPDQGALRP